MATRLTARGTPSPWPGLRSPCARACRRPGPPAEEGGHGPPVRLASPRVEASLGEASPEALPANSAGKPVKPSGRLAESGPGSVAPCTRENGVPVPPGVRSRGVTLFTRSGKCTSAKITSQLRACESRR